MPWLLLIFAVFHAVELTTFQWSIDEEMAAFRDRADVWVRQGRWTVYLFETFLLPQPVIPFVPHALFGLFVSIAYLLVLRGHRVRKPDMVHYALFPLFAAFPIWSFLLEFMPNTPAVGFGVLASATAAAVYAGSIRGDGVKHESSTNHQRWGRLVFAGVCGAVALGAYQSALFLISVLGLSVVITDSLHHGTSLRRIVQCLGALALLLVVVVVIYYGVWWLFLAWLDLEARYVEGYVSGQFFANPLQVVSTTLYGAGRLYLGHPSIYGAHAFGFGLVIVCGLAAIAVTPLLAGFRTRAIVLVLAIATLAIPFTLHLVSGGWMPLRSLISLPATIWFFGLLGLTVGNRWIARVALVAVLLAAWHSLYAVNLFQAGAAVAREHDRALAFALYRDIQAAHPDFSHGHEYEVEFYGAVNVSTVYPQVPSSTRVRSFFEWAGGNPVRIVAYMRLIGFDNLRVATPKERLKLLPVLERMPIWPNPGSIRVVDNVTLVRLGEAPGTMHRKTGAGR